MNFTLFNFMNELHSEAARLEEQIGEFKRELEELQGSGGDQQGCQGSQPALLPGAARLPR